MHFLWFIIVHGLSYLTNSKEIFLIIVLLSNTIIMGFSFLPIWKIGKNIKNDYFGLILSMIWGLQLLIFDTFFMGMGNAIHSIILWYIILYLVRIFKNSDKIKKNFLILSLLLIINIWVRYDSIIFSGIIFATIIIYYFIYQKRLSIKTVSISFILSIFGLIILLLVYYIMGDTFIPINAKIKISKVQNTNFVNYLNNILFIITPYIFTNRIRINLAISSILTIMFCLLNLIILNDIFKKKREINQIKILILILSFPNLVYSLIIGTMFDSYYLWYLSLSFIIWTIIFSYFLNILISKFIEKVRNYKKLDLSKYFQYNQIIIFGAVIQLSLSIPLFIYLNKTPTYYSNNESANFYLVRYNAAIWLRDNTNKNDIVGSWNAGEIGFFSDRKVINLDGLVNDIDYFTTILSDKDRFNSTAFMEYLNNLNITYLVDYRFYGFDPIQANYTLIKEFYYGDPQNPIQIWIR